MRRLFIAGWAVLAGSCVVDLGDNFVAPDLNLDEAYFYCVIQPQVINTAGCSSGMGAEMGTCHADRSSLRLKPVMDVAGWCNGETLTGTPSADARSNFE